MDKPEVNIGLVGHVDHGKTTLTKRLSGKWTDTHSEELKRGITIRLGYADTTFYKDGDNYDTKGKNKLRTVSFVDAPGHESLMATMLAGATIMDGALLLIAANDKCPQPQTKEHLMALQISGINNVVVVQTKIDLVTEEKAMKNYEQIKEFLKGTDYENAPIVPISALHDVNINYLIKAIEETIPTPKRDDKADPIMFIARSFDINKPGMNADKLQGGILGGAVVKGTIKKGDVIEIRPGRIVQEANQMKAKPLTTTVVSCNTGGKEVDKITPGGSVGVMTKLDPSIVGSDNLVGNLIGLEGKLPQVWDSIRLKITLLDRVVGSEEEIKVDPLKMGEPLMLNVNSAATVGIITKLSDKEISCKLKLPICADKGSRVTISRRVGTRFRLIGYGILE